MKLLMLAASLACAPAMAQIYKCPDASGRTVVQQMPCAGGKQLEVRPASGGGAPAPLASASAAASGAKVAPQMTEAERLNAQTAASQRERRRRELQQIFVPEANAAVYNQRAACNKRVADLKAGQYQYRQNLYGKTHAAQVASEMAAVTAQCDTKDRELVNNHNTLLNECKQLGGCAAMAPM